MSTTTKTSFDNMKDSKALYKTVNRISVNIEERIYPSFDTDQNLADSMTKVYSEQIIKIREAISEKNVK